MMYYMGIQITLVCLFFITNTNILNRPHYYHLFDTIELLYISTNQSYSYMYKLW